MPIAQSAGGPSVVPPDVRPEASCDQEAWVTERIETAIKMGIALAKQQHVGADEHGVEHGILGIAQGTAIEVIHTLGMRPSYVNLKNLRLRNQSRPA